MIETGKALKTIKENVGHGNWLPWLEAEGRMSPSTAKNFMRIAEVYGNRQGLVDLNIGVEALAILSQNNTSDEVRETAELMSQAGIPVTAKVSKELKEMKAENERLQAELDKAKEPDQSNLIPEQKSPVGRSTTWPGCSMIEDS